MRKVRGPATGYVSDAKADYRESVWTALSRVSPLLREDSRLHVLLMPSKGGEEIDVAVAHGIPPDRIVAVDDNPAVIAASAWRKKWPTVKFYGVRLSGVAEKLERDGIVIAAANFDLCSNFSESTLSEIAAAVNIPRMEGWLWALNIAKGREDSAVAYLLNRLDVGMYGLKSTRVRCVLDYLATHDRTDVAGLLLEAQGSYTGGRVPMTWAVFSDATHARDSFARATMDAILRAYRRMDHAHELIRSAHNIRLRSRFFCPDTRKRMTTNNPRTAMLLKTFDSRHAHYIELLRKAFVTPRNALTPERFNSRRRFSAGQFASRDGEWLAVLSDVADHERGFAA